MVCAAKKRFSAASWSNVPSAGPSLLAPLARCCSSSAAVGYLKRKITP